MDEPVLQQLQNYQQRLEEAEAKYQSMLDQQLSVVSGLPAFQGTWKQLPKYVAYQAYKQVVEMLKKKTSPINEKLKQVIQVIEKNDSKPALSLSDFKYWQGGWDRCLAGYEGFLVKFSELPRLYERYLQIVIPQAFHHIETLNIPEQFKPSLIQYAQNTIIADANYNVIFDLSYLANQTDFTTNLEPIGKSDFYREMESVFREFINNALDVVLKILSDHNIQLRLKDFPDYDILMEIRDWVIRNEKNQYKNYPEHDEDVYEGQQQPETSEEELKPNILIGYLLTHPEDFEYKLKNWRSTNETFNKQLISYIYKNHLLKQSLIFFSHFKIAALEIIFEFITKQNKDLNWFIKYCNNFSFDSQLAKDANAIQEVYTLEFLSGAMAVDLLSDVIRGLQTIQTDCRILKDILEEIHNNTNLDLERSDARFHPGFSILEKIIKNPNFYKGSHTIVQFFSLYAQLVSSYFKDHYGGLDKIDEMLVWVEQKLRYVAAEDLKISPTFLDDLKTIIYTFKENRPVSQHMTSLIKRVSVDFDLVINYEEIKDILNEAKKYQTRKAKTRPFLDRLDMQYGELIRFRVLKDDEFIKQLRIGELTDCCQTIGGAGQIAAADSLINPLAGVLVLEVNRPSGWEILAQSYFHFVPQASGGPGYILDNVEKNDKLSLELSGKESKAFEDLSVLYNKFAKDIVAKLNSVLPPHKQIKYFLCGRDYNKLDNNEFKNIKLEKDPRYFSPYAQEQGIYSDFDHSHALDLLNYDRADEKSGDQLFQDLMTRLPTKLNKQSNLLAACELFYKKAIHSLQDTYLQRLKHFLLPQ